MEFSIGGTAYIYETQVDDELLRTMNGTFINSYGIDTERTEAIDLMQQNVRIFFFDSTFICFNLINSNISLLFSLNAVEQFDSKIGV